MKFNKAFVAVLSMTLVGSSWAGVGSSLMQTANVRGVGEIEAKAQADVTLNQGGGFNITAHGVTGLIQHMMDVDVLLGTGATDFQIGALLKYNVLPDIEGQFGLSLLTGYRLIRDNDKPTSDLIVTNNLFTFGALTSKRIEAETMAFSPYAAFQIESLYKTNASVNPMSLVLGSKWEPQSTVPWSYYTELGLSLKDSHYNFCFGTSYFF